ncbi:MAG TPA: prepilin-type N-terminal cleavage/methylation domain-containing protein [Vicinamibacteria bacterium]|nr:prepilin-type N-terminal cleavage/methylation domain-containing protein [Vicinamibacteria bacterium]
MIRLRTHDHDGFSLIEVLVAMFVTLIVMASVFALLQKGQRSFRREPEVTDMTASARAGVDWISRDLAIAGFAAPPNIAIMWFDGGGPANAPNPDELTIVYSDPEVPWCRPKPCGSGGGGGSSKGGRGGGGGGGPCSTIGMSSVLNVDPDSFSYPPGDFEQVYHDGQMLMAIQGPNGDPACNNVAPGIYPFELTSDPKCTGAGGANSGPAGCATLQLSHNPQGDLDINVPGGFQRQVSADCAIIGWFHMVQYRVNPWPPADNPMLERRDIVLGEPWTPVSNNIENFQVQYAQGVSELFVDEPPLIPLGGDPNTWITQVRFTVTGRSESTNLEGGSQGVFDPNDTHIRRSFTTTMSLRNQLMQASNMGLSWN